MVKCFEYETVGNIEFIYLVARMIDPASLSNLHTSILCGNLRLFGDSPRVIADFCVTSARWTLFEQFSMWKLFLAEFSDVSFENRTEIFSILVASLGENKSPELVNSISIFLLFPVNVDMLEAILFSQSSDIITNFLIQITRRNDMDTILSILMNFIGRFSINEIKEDTPQSESTNPSLDIFEIIQKKRIGSKENILLMRQNISEWKIKAERYKFKCGKTCTDFFNIFLSKLSTLQ